MLEGRLVRDKIGPSLIMVFGFSQKQLGTRAWVSVVDVAEASQVLSKRREDQPPQLEGELSLLEHGKRVSLQERVTSSAVDANDDAHPAQFVQAFEHFRALHARVQKDSSGFWGNTCAL